MNQSRKDVDGVYIIPESRKNYLIGLKNSMERQGVSIEQLADHLNLSPDYFRTVLDNRHFISNERVRKIIAAVWVVASKNTALQGIKSKQK